jgi:alpha-tubulin suppressor-like RCC1 family protein
VATVLVVPLTEAPASAAGTTPSTVSAGLSSSCGIYAGSVQCWGTSPLGDGTTNRASRGPVTGLESGAVSVVGGFLSACALTTAGGVKCWGDNRSGQLGDGTTVDRDLPVDVVGLTSGVTQIDTGGYQTCAVTTAGAVQCWGGGGPLTPTTVPTLGSGMASVSVGSGSACAVSTTGAAYCWGSNIGGQLGTGTNTSTSTPIAVPGLSSGVRSISMGTYHGCAVLTDGGVRCWGSSFTGAVGPNPTSYYSPPVPVPVTGAIGVAAGYDSSCALLSSGQVQCWGRNMMLGDGSTTDRAQPGPVAGVTTATSVAIGYNHACASVASGVVCWGSGSGGVLGDGTRDEHRRPVSVVYRPAEIVPRLTEVVEGDSGTTTLLARVELSVAAPTTVTVDWATTPGTPSEWEATAGADYVADRGTVTFSPGQRVASIPITVVGDLLDERDEAIHYTLSNPVGAPISTDLFGAQGLIRDDDATPRIVPGAVYDLEGDAGTTTVRVPFTLSNPSAFEITVPWTTLYADGAPAGQADPGTDYVVASGTVTVPAGATSGYAEIEIVGDVDVEVDEYIVVSFRNPTNARMGGFWGLGFAVSQNDD